ALLIPGFGIGFGSATGPSSSALGWYLVGWAIVTGIFMLGTFRLNGGLALVFILLFVTYILLAVGAFQGQGAGVGLTQIGGYVGIATAIAAFYVALAAILSATSNGKFNLPVIPLS
ncbi:MAG: acetate uptake transporter, partial [Ktedonobacterales bacterium]